VVGWLALTISAGFSNPRSYFGAFLTRHEGRHPYLWSFEDGLVCMRSLVSVTSRSTTKQVG